MEQLDSIAELCRREGLHQNQYYRWSKTFLEAGRKRLAGDTEREATRDEATAGQTRAVLLAAVGTEPSDETAVC